MIEVTDEMVRLIYQRIDFVMHDNEGIREGLADVFELVERDYRVTRPDSAHDEAVGR